MTLHYNELAVADPVFGQLRNCMELAVAAALVAKENLTEKAGNPMETLLGPQPLTAQEFPAPRQVSTQASAVHKQGHWVISASGGVKIGSWQALGQSQTDDAPLAVRSKAAPANTDAWWWN